MSDNFDPFRNDSGDFDHAGSVNAGRWQADTGGALSPQQADESSGSFDTRFYEYNHTKENDS
jgi:hypothetical protein